MTYYIKANPKVAEYLGLENDRWKLDDGNYLLWQNDLMAFAPLYLLADTCKRIGAAMLDGDQARMEQRGEICTALPEAEDEQFRMPSDDADNDAEPEEEAEA